MKDKTAPLADNIKTNLEKGVNIVKEVVEDGVEVVKEIIGIKKKKRKGKGKDG